MSDAVTSSLTIVLHQEYMCLLLDALFFFFSTLGDVPYKFSFKLNQIIFSHLYWHVSSTFHTLYNSVIRFGYTENLSNSTRVIISA